MKTVLITGATGLIGQEIVNQCHERGSRVHYLTTSKSKITQSSNYKGFYWNPEQNIIDKNALSNVDAIINLAGEPIAQRWTAAAKENIIRSRIESLHVLFETIKANNFKIGHLISASAIGYYPDSLTNYYEEDFDSDADGFLINVVKQWENAADKFKELGIAVSKIRVGIVLSKNGGALPKLVKPITNFVGAPLGSGKQWQSWIHIEDLARLFIYTLDNRLSGVYNAVAPNPVTQETFTKLVARIKNKPLIFPTIPSFILKLALGEMSRLITEGQRVSSKKIEQNGFYFNYNQIDHALEDLL